MKFNIFNPFGNLLRKLVEAPEQAPPVEEPPVAPAPKRSIVMAPRPEPFPSANNRHHQNGRGVELPLQPIFASLPQELQGRLVQPDAGGLTISIPLEKILAQLSRGAVHISFGEIRQAAPDFFTPENDRDRVAVLLPLGEILSRLNPALINRRRTQKQIEVPADIASPFDPGSRSLIYSVGPSKPPSVPAPGPMPPPRQVAVPAPKPAPAPARAGMTFVPPPAPPTATPPLAPATTFTLRTPQEPAPSPTPVVVPAPAAPAPIPFRPAADPNPLLINLTSLAEGWPEAVRQELVQLNLVDARVALPTEIVERALKQGRVVFTWRTLRSWIKPAPLPSLSAHDSAALELPLKVVAPLFLARRQETGKAQQKVDIDKDIPDVFFGFPQPASDLAAAGLGVSTSPPKPQDTNFYVWDDTTDRARVQEDETKRGPTPGTKFVAKYATPNEVVSRAAVLDGVTGVLIALPDGLMVASRLSPDLNGDTLAAFLPQIFGKITQCTKELRMGELNNVGFTVGNVPWKIFRVNAIFFAAFGRPGEPLPTAQLSALAAELDHKPK
ncbi:MAG TPA: roadblock/LC7 domain-containing protein [Candidatus Paceibacterota bacterium]|nr:roadblock/LC7 domain-containing protein [Verrucomicrobiota bacterium]HSA10713.1 roadblock/LC7 domain-containing protein [Candidatus Paceibacterota bacterium]